MQRKTRSSKMVTRALQVSTWSCIANHRYRCAAGTLPEVQFIDLTLVFFRLTVSRRRCCSARIIRRACEPYSGATLCTSAWCACISCLERGQTHLHLLVQLNKASQHGRAKGAEQVLPAGLRSGEVAQGQETERQHHESSHDASHEHSVFYLRSLHVQGNQVQHHQRRCGRRDVLGHPNLSVCLQHSDRLVVTVPGHCLLIALCCLVRFYLRCSTCAAEITMKTDPENTDYTMEHGASRNYEPWREKAKQTNTALADR